MAFKAAVAMALFAGVDGVRNVRKSEEERNSCGKVGRSLDKEWDGPNASIVNGVDAKECRWKWQVGLKSRESGRPWCGGSLISPEWVLTAAHCIDDESNRGVYVVAGEWNVKRKSGNEQNQRSKKVIVHPRYNDDTDDFDIGLIRLSNKMRMTDCVGLVCLPSRDLSSDTTCWTTGWGDLKYDGKPSDILQEGQVKTMSNRACQNTGYKKNDIKSSMLCAQGRRNGKVVDACSGDSGGPLVCESSGKWTVYGATSWGKDCALKNYPGVWARVHYAMDFIRKESGV